MLNFIDKIPAHLRGWFYFITALLLVAVLVALLVVEILGGGDPGEWLQWVVVTFGIGASGLAARNTTRTKDG